MEIPQNVQDKLKCSECDELLSCGPVYLLHGTGGDICGRCSQQFTDSNESEDRTRNDSYEAVASLLAFPCAFAARGCPEKQSFVLGQPPHELNCKFRTFICPIAPRGSCEWIGSWPKLKSHCDEKHAANVIENPCNPPRPDLITTNLQTYLISAFHFLFLLHIKVCVTSGKLYHSVRMFGESKFLDKFSFTLEIEGNGIKVIKSGSVLRAGILTIQEPTAISTSINSLLGMLDGKYNESKFTITIKFLNCSNCSKNIDKDSNTIFCDECLEKLVKCKFNGKSCLFVDVVKKRCEKHEMFFCEYQTNCFYCEVSFVRGSFIGHLTSSNSCRKTIQSNIDSVVRVTPNTTSYVNYILFSSNNIGTIICHYYLCDSNVEIYLRTSLPSYELKNYKCSIELTDPETKHTQTLTPQIQYNNNDWNDWSIVEKLYNFSSWNNVGIDIKINIDKHQN